MDVLRKLVALGSNLLRFGQAQLFGGKCGILIARQRPEIIPQAILRGGAIALMTDRRRHQTIAHALVADQIFGSPFGLALHFHIAEGRCDAGPIAGQFGPVMIVTIELHQQMDIFPLRIIFRDRVRTAIIDAAWYFAVVEELVAVPVGKFASRRDDTHSQQAVRHHRAITDPAAVVGTGTRLEPRTVPTDQHMRQRSPQRVSHHMFGVRHMQGQFIQLARPDRHRPGLCFVERGKILWGLRSSMGNGHGDVDFLARSKLR